MNLRAKFAGLIATSLLVSLLLPAVVAEGSPIDDKKAQAARLQAQIESTNERLGALGEQYNGAVYRLQKVQAGIAEAEARTKEAEAETAHIKKLISARAAEIYKGAGTSSPLDVVDVSSVTEMSARSKYASAAAQHDGSLLDRLQKAKEDLAAQRAALDQQKASAQAQKDAAAKAKADLDSANAQRKRLLSQTQGELKALVAQEAARQAAAARARAQAFEARRATGGAAVRPGRSSHSELLGNIPPVSGRAGTAIAFARAQLGKPYRYATSGPATYDCSGLTAAAWGAAGVSLPHYSGAQWDMLPHIPLSAVQPGDLIFYGPGGSRHVEIYIGGGMVITAPQTGDVVKVAPLRSSAIGAGRPG